MTPLLQLLEVGPGSVVAAVGAGGKTTLVYRLAAQAREAGWRVLVTTTTHMGTLPEEVTGPVLVEAEGDTDGELDRALAQQGRATLLGRRLRDDKLEGIAPERVDELAGRADLVLVEADGARGRSLKVPAPHEPVVPASTRLVLVVAALDSLGRPLEERTVHRLDRVLLASGQTAGEPIGEATIAACLTHAEGYPARVPGGARLAAFLNKAEEAPAREAAARIADAVIPPYAFVLAGSARSGRGWRRP